jgi:perosamine synthetase
MGVAPRKSRWVSPFPMLSLGMSLPRNSPKDSPFPLDQPSLQYFYLARNGIHAAAQRWKLRDQEMLFPSYCHGIEVATLRAEGVKLRFYPVRSGMRVYPEDVLAALSPATRAVYLIHYLGFPSPVEEIRAICRERNLLLFEDCALALFSQLGDKPLGSFGDAAVFCFYKTVPTPHGGALWMRDPGSGQWPPTRPPSTTSTIAYAATAAWRHLNFNGGGGIHRLLRAVRNSARAISGTLGVAPVGRADLDSSTIDLAMSRFSHWVLANQNYAEVVERRRRNYSLLLERLREVSAPIFENLPDAVCPLFYPFSTPDKPTLLARLFERGIDAGNFWSQHPSMAAEGSFPESDTLRRTIVEIPCHQDLDTEAIEWIADQVCECTAATAPSLSLLVGSVR